MSFIIELPRPVEARLQSEAIKAGVSPTDYAVELIAKSLPATVIDEEEQKRVNTPSLRLLEAWLQRARTPATAEQIAEAEAEQTAFMRNMNAPRQEAGERLLYPDVEPFAEGG